MSTTARPGYCPFCGAVAPSWYTACPRCHRALPSGGPSPADRPAAGTDPLAPWAGDRFVPIGPLGALFGRAGIVWFSLGIAGIVVGIFLLVGGSLIGLVFSATGQACSVDPLCTVTGALRIVLVVTGLLVFLAGFGAIAYGFRQRSDGGPSLTLPP